MLELLKNLARAAALYFEIKRLSAAYDLTCRIEADNAARQAEIDRLRRAGGNDNNLRADIVREQLLRAQGIVADLPAASIAAASGSPDSDEGRTIHAAD